MKLYFDNVKLFFKEHPEVDIVNTCIICGNSTTDTLFESEDTVKCLKCGFAWRPYQPTEEVLTEFYNSYVMNQWEQIKTTDHEKERMKNKYERIWNRLSNDSSVLDVGCGSGRHFLNGLFSSGKSFKCLDGIEIGDTIPEKKYDYITLWGVLEHLKQPKAWLKQIYDLLEYSGELIVCVPNVDSLVIQTLKDECSTFCPQHLWFFNIDTLTQIMAQLNFERVDWWTIESEINPIERKMVNLPPYINCSTWQTLRETTILEKNLGYKIVSVWRKR